MRVLVTVKEVADVAADVQFADTDVEETSLEYELNEWDDYAIEAGVRLVEAGVADEVVVATIGPERAEETVQMALAKGADRAVRVWDDALAEQDLLDVETKADIFAAIVDAEDPAIVLTGVQASDDGFGATGVALAERLGYGWAAVVTGLDLDVEAGVARVRRELEGGVDEHSTVTLPAVFTIQTGINEPRYASLRGIREARDREIERRTLDDLDLAGEDVTSAMQIVDAFEPVSESDVEFLDGEPEEQAARIGDVLEDRGVLEE